MKKIVLFLAILTLATILVLVSCGGEEPCTHTPNEPTRENVVDATCESEGSYTEIIVCSLCGEEISRTEKTIEKLEHTPADPIREDGRAATCEEAGNYFEVVKCSVCVHKILQTSWIHYNNG